MLNLQKTMKKDEFNKFVNKSCFSSIDGLTHGRGLSERTLAKFVTCSPEFLKISEAHEGFSECSTVFSEQHTELRSTRRERDLQNVNKLVNWFQGHHPFRQDNELVSLSSVFVVTRCSVKCDDAYEVGLCCMKESEGNNNKVKPIAAVASSIRVRSDNVAINPNQLFNRVICISQGTQNLKCYFRYELSPYPRSSFKNNKMLQKGTKSSIMKVFVEWSVSG
ncbi:hypothetical protein PR048_014332 [Dryococelus australis]|uniref:Uncharacterized protein n=1 Tax=Dryococelus australis TaxID=614101 RepID=A0ABQ9HDY4_9NEOP|nr:hypothetical protein PR048_014332 [Dryococelus australis]